MKFALTISSYLFHEFVELNVVMLRKIFGMVPVLVSDDKSDNSPLIESVAAKYGCAYTCSRVHRGHFANDCQSIVNALTFGESVGADVAAKVSFRLILLAPEIKTMLEDRFERQDYLFAVPSKLRPEQVRTKAGLGFSLMPMLSDVVFLRVGSINPNQIIEHYRQKFHNERHIKHGSFVEALVCDLYHGHYKDRGILLDELSYHRPGVPHWYLRKTQNHRQQYVDLARSLGIDGAFDIREWSSIIGAGYMPKPALV